MNKINPSIFRAYDIRGRVGRQGVNKQTVGLIGSAFGTYLARRGIKQIVVGHDFRPHSEELKKVFRQSALATGLQVVDIGLTLSPVLHYAQYHFKILGGAMITASHNAKTWNGLKLMQGLSRDLAGPEIQEIYQIAKKGEFKKGEGLLKIAPINRSYIEATTHRVKLKKTLKVVVNCGHGTTAILAPEVLRRAGCQVVELFCGLDESFKKHHPDQTSKIMKKSLADRIKASGADLGVSYDGDGDRLGLTDENGQAVSSDRLLILLSRQVLKKNPGAKIIFDVKCTQALPLDIKEKGGIPLMSRTGHSFLTKRVKDEGAMLGGERSGHFVFNDNWFGFDDAVFASLRALEYITEQDEPLSALIKKTPLKDYPMMPTTYITCPDKEKFSIVDKIKDEFKKELGEEKIITIDGARIDFGDGWGLIRASSTEPALTVVIEAKNKTKLNEIKEIFKKKLKKYSSVSSRWQSR